MDDESGESVFLALLGSCMAKTLSVTLTQVTAAGEDADVVNGNASKQVSELCYQHQLYRLSTSQSHKAASPHATWRPSTNPLGPRIHL